MTPEVKAAAERLNQAVHVTKAVLTERDELVMYKCAEQAEEAMKRDPAGFDPVAFWTEQVL